MLFLACALAALVALGMATGRGLGDEVAAAAVPPARPTGTGVGTNAALVPAPALPPLPTTSLAERLLRRALTAAPEHPVLADRQIISYYGNPSTGEMGILGAADLETVAAQLEEHAARYDRLNGATDVVPALHLVYAVAQYHPTTNGLYLQYVSDADVRRLLALTEERGMLLFLDLQIGRSTVEAELRKVLPYLRYPQVHLAIDPEYAVGSTEVPGEALGSLAAADVDRAQDALQRLVRAEGLPPKLLIIHQFVDSMVPDADAIQRYPDVELIIDMDGIGLAAIKRANYQRYAALPYAFHVGIKLYFQHDPDLMPEEEVLSLEPRPVVIIYQ